MPDHSFLSRPHIVRFPSPNHVSQDCFRPLLFFCAGSSPLIFIQAFGGETCRNGPCSLSGTYPPRKPKPYHTTKSLPSLLPCMVAHAAQRERRPFVVYPVPDRGEQGFCQILEVIYHIAGAGNAALLANGSLHAQVERERERLRRSHGNTQLAYAAATLVARGIDAIAEGP